MIDGNPDLGAANYLMPATPFLPPMTLAAPPRYRLPDPADLDRFLDEAADQLEDQETIPAIWVPLLIAAEHLRRTIGDSAWHSRLRGHRVAMLLREDPAVAWSYRRPRGYAGDAHLIDFLYEHPSTQDEILAATSRGRTLNAMVLASAAPVAVQERRRLLGRLLDATAERVGRAEALVLACGHLREAEFALSLDQFDRLVALDQDRESIAEMKRCYSDIGALVPVEASIGRMIVRPLVHGRFDLIYAAGLYDYLDDLTAVRLTHGMFSALKPGGRLLFANFCSGLVDYGFMDAFMDWRLIQRDEPEMQRLIDALPAADIARTTVFRGLNQATIYALVEKR
ncbi:MAG TPA: class I SAM-dependent methyltransferase [Acetobacteraceae bacterium]|jgi:SAM-dependent methyltransferase